MMVRVFGVNNKKTFLTRIALTPRSRVRGVSSDEGATIVSWKRIHTLQIFENSPGR